MPGFNILGSGGDANAQTDVLRSYRWGLELPRAGGASFDKDDDNMILEATVPQMDFEVLLIQGQSLDYKIPKKPKFNDVDITFYDVGGLQLKFENWMDKIWNPRDGLFEGKAPTDLKNKIKIKLLDNKGNKVRVYSLMGAWPKRMSHSKLNMSSDTLKTLVVEFSYDYYQLDEAVNQ